MLYKLGDAYAGSLTTTFLIRGVGFSATEVGAINKVLGLIATIIGALTGGVLGVLMMVPLRRYLIVKEHKTLRYPEGRACAEILEAGRRAAALTKQLLTFSRKQVLKPEPLDPSALIRSAVTLLERLLGEDIQVTTSFAPEVPRIMADRGQNPALEPGHGQGLRQVIRHMVPFGSEEGQAGSAAGGLPGLGQALLRAALDAQREQQQLQGAGLQRRRPLPLQEPAHQVRPRVLPRPHLPL